MESFGDRLKYIRKNLKLSQENLSKILYTGSRNISNWEKGKSFPRENHIQDIRKLRDMYGVSINWLLTGEGGPFENGYSPESHKQNIINQEFTGAGSGNFGISNVGVSNNKVYTGNSNVTNTNTASKPNIQSNYDITDRLFKLDKMVKEGLLTKEEFKKIKTGLLQDL